VNSEAAVRDSTLSYPNTTISRRKGPLIVARLRPRWPAGARAAVDGAVGAGRQETVCRRVPRREGRLDGRR
jgi:hypothetical protein